MVQDLTAALAEWASSLRAADIPERTARRAGWQWASVLGAIRAVADHPHSRAIGKVALHGSSGGRSTLFPEVASVPTEAAVWGNAARSVLLDYDDYLFAGHTGHSAVLVTLALGESLDAAGEDLLCATVAANEAGGRLGAAMLLGPHNGQMWAYIHNIAGAVAAARLLRLDASETAAAVGLSLTQPPYPLASTFMGSDGKALTASGPSVEGLRAALLASEGMRCDVDVLTDRNGFFAKIYRDAMGGFFSGFGSAWVTDSLTYKIYPGCAYLDTAVDAVLALRERYRAERGEELDAGSIVSGRIEAGLLTVGMEQMSGWYRGPGRALREINVNFSAAYSVAIALVAGRLSAGELLPAWWSPRVEEIEGLAGRLEVVMDDEMNRRMRSEHGFDVAKVIGRARDEPVLDDVTFADHETRFPATVELRLVDGSVWRETAEVPLGGSGRPEDETRALVAAKLDAGDDAFKSLENLASLGSARDIARLLS